MKLTRNNKFKKIRKTRNNRQNKKIRKTRNGKQNKRITKKQNNAQNKKIKGGDSSLIGYTSQRTLTIGLGTTDLYVDRFICRNQDFSSLMNKKFVKEMNVIDTFLIYPHITNYTFNDSYNIPFTEPVLFELFDMCKFRIKKFLLLPNDIFNESINTIRNMDSSNIKNIFRTSSRYKLLRFFFKELYSMLDKNSIDKISLEGNNRIQDEEESDETVVLSNRIDDDIDDYVIQFNKGKEITVEKADLDLIKTDNTTTNLDPDNVVNVSVINNVNRIDHDENANRIPEGIEIEDDDVDSKNMFTSLFLYAKDFFTFNDKTDILSRLNKYIFIEDLIYVHRPHNITPFYTKKEAIIYLCGLLLNKEDINLYDDDTVKIVIEKSIEFENKNNISYLDNKKVYNYLNTYIDTNTFDKKNPPVYFSDILYRYRENVDDDYNEISNILYMQIDIINKLIEKIIEKKNNNEITVEIIEKSFVNSYKKMIENRKFVVNKLFDNLNGDYSKILELASQIDTFRNLIIGVGMKITHYNCTAPINLIPMFYKHVVLFFMGGMAVGPMTFNCYISAVTFFTILYIFRGQFYNSIKNYNAIKDTRYNINRKINTLIESGYNNIEYVLNPNYLSK